MRRRDRDRRSDTRATVRRSAYAVLNVSAPAAMPIANKAPCSSNRHRHPVAGPVAGCGTGSGIVDRLATLAPCSATATLHETAQHVDFLAPRSGLEPGTCGLTDCRRVAIFQMLGRKSDPQLPGICRPQGPFYRGFARNCGTEFRSFSPDQNARSVTPRLSPRGSRPRLRSGAKFRRQVSCVRHRRRAGVPAHSPVARTGLPLPEKSQVEERRPTSTRPDSMIVAATSKPGVDTVVPFGTLVVPKT